MSPGACLHSNVRSFSHPDYTVGSGIAPDLRGNSLARGLASHQRSLTAGRDWHHCDASPCPEEGI